MSSQSPRHRSVLPGDVSEKVYRYMVRRRKQQKKVKVATVANQYALRSQEMWELISADDRLDVVWTWTAKNGHVAWLTFAEDAT